MHDFFNVEFDTFPVVMTPATDSVKTAESLAQALGRHQAEVKAMLHEKGTLLIRDFDLIGAKEFNKVASTLLTSQFDYTLGDSPRSRIEKNIYSSTDYPSEYSISLHQEMSYSKVRPNYVCFFCDIAPMVGGATPIADFHKIIDILPEHVVEKFTHTNLRYRRTLHGGFGLGKSWSQTFNTDDRSCVEDILRSIDARFEWLGDGSLRIEEEVPGVINHPITGKKIWFNQAEQWHPSSLNEDVREGMKELMPEESFPHYVEFADGNPIDMADLQIIRSAQEKMIRRFEWRQGDLLVVDNFLVAHGRDPFKGPRKILVSLGN